MLEIFENPMVWVIYALIIGIYIGRYGGFRRYTLLSILLSMTEGMVNILDYLWERKHTVFPFFIVGLSFLILWIPVIIISSQLISSLVTYWLYLILIPYYVILVIFLSALGIEVVRIIEGAWNNSEGKPEGGGS